MTTTAADADHDDLAEFGYKRELDRSIGKFASFAAGVSYISILTGTFQLFFFGFATGGPAYWWSWPLVFVGQLMIALCFAELAAVHPVAGSVYDQQIIENLGLDLKVVHSGSEKATLAALDDAFKRKAPLLLSFWTSHWAHAKYSLTEVRLPPFDKACADAARTKGAAGYDCDYADDILFKAFWIGLEGKAPNAFRILSNFQFTNDEQDQVAFQVDVKGVPVATAARRWVDHVWRAWLRQ